MRWRCIAPCLCQELAGQGVPFTRQVVLPVTYKTTRIEGAYRMDIVVAGRVVVEVKAAEKLLPIDLAQVLTYMRLAYLPLGLLLNFQTAALRDGIRRLAMKPSPS